MRNRPIVWIWGLVSINVFSPGDSFGSGRKTYRHGNAPHCSTYPHHLRQSSGADPFVPNTFTLGWGDLSSPNPQFNWTTGTPLGWSVACHTHCLQSAISLSPEASGCPTALPDQFSVDLLPLPSSQLYNLSHPERWEDTSLRRCIYYRALIEITKCNKYPLSLLDAAFAPLHKGASSPSWISATLTTLSTSVMETSGKLPLTRPSVISSTCRWLTNAPAIFQALVKDMLHMALDATLSPSWGYHPQSTGRWRGQPRPWKTRCHVWRLDTRLPGVPIFHGLSMPITHWSDLL